MKKILTFLLVVILLIVAAVMSIPYWFNINDYKRNIVNFVNDKTGYKVDIKGDLTAELFPNVSVVLNDVSVKANESDKKNLFQAKQLVLNIKTSQLLQKKIDVNSLEFIDTKFNLITNINGKNNWKIEKKVGSVATEKDNNEANKVKKIETVSDLYKVFSLNSVKIVNSSFNVLNFQKNQDFSIRSINLETSFKEGDNKISFSALVGNGENTYDTSLEGTYALGDKLVDLKGAKFKINGLSAKGSIKVDLTNNKPFLNVNLASDKLDLNRLIVGGESEGKSGENADISKDKKIDLSFLKSFDAKVNVTLNGVTYSDVEIDEPITITKDIKNGNLKGDISVINLYGGKIKSDFTLSSNKGQSYKLNLDVKDVDLSKLPESSDKFNLVEGGLSSSVNLESYGTTKKQLLRNISGIASLNLEDGIVEGLGILSKIDQLVRASAPKKEINKTRFNKISAVFNIKDAVARNDDFKLISDIANFKGYGNIDLYDQVIDFKVIPKYTQKFDSDEANSTDADEVAANPIGLIQAGTKKPEIPILITGSLKSPKVRIDATSAIRDVITNPQSGKDLLDQLKNGVKKGNSIKDIKNLLKR